MSAPVVVGVDGSPESLAALDWAADEASRRGAPLRLVHAWPSPVTPLSVLGTADLERRQADVVLREAELRARDRCPEAAVTAVHVPGDAVRALVVEAGEAGLLVLGSRGLGTVAGFLVGSVSHRVLGRAACPVVLVRRGEDPDAPAGAEVVAGVDPYDGADEVLAHAFESAARLRLPVRAVYAWTLPPSYQYAGIAAGVDVTGEMSAQARRELAALILPWRAKYPQVTVVEETVNARPARVLAERAADAELLVVGRRVRRSPVGVHVGAVAHAVLHHAPCPVAVVPYERVREQERGADADTP
ncbi:universal stress protein [Streptomyces sp. BE20]|uniref:universal stress protein n=1 Tax=Streptomyces sp. BE20 TaxID=3002525 RepID=UPI002E76D6A6|nr:universal stress protein [Streptomyces sp. BE20]MEE1823446.1 universal stress protein [Streptomyces sp. BE20]